MTRVLWGVPFRWAFSAALVISAVGFWIGFQALGAGGGVDPGATTVGPATVPASLAVIVVRNVGAAALLYSGVATAGVSTGIGLILIASYVGATLATAIGNAGASGVLGSIGAYAPLEMVGLLVCAAAGLLPVVRALRGSVAGRRFDAYRQGLGTSVAVAGYGVVIIVAAACMEALVISSR